MPERAADAHTPVYPPSRAEGQALAVVYSERGWFGAPPWTGERRTGQGPQEEGDEERGAAW